MTKASGLTARGDSLVPVRRVAERLGVSVFTVRRLMDRGELGFVRMGKFRHVSEAQLAEFIAARRQDPDQ